MTRKAGLGRKLLAALMAACALAGCGTSLPPDPDVRAELRPARWKDQRLEVDVPVPVITFGLPQSTVATLQATLRSRRVEQASFDLNHLLPRDSDSVLTGGDVLPLPVVPTARYRVLAAPPTLEAEFRQQVAVSGLDGNHMEDWLGQALPRHGFPLDPAAPSVVLLHMKAFGFRNHGWTYRSPIYEMKPVRVFGERLPLLVLDPSAGDDPFAGSGGYNSPVAADNAQLLEEFVDAAIDYRLLQGSLYAVPQAPCQAITGIVAASAASLGENLVSTVEENVHPDLIHAALSDLTGTETFLDVKILSLPVDDPVLDALGRGPFLPLLANPSYEALVGWITANWETYHVDHPGCEEYINLVFAGDMGYVKDTQRSLTGSAGYDSTPGKRLSITWGPDLDRLFADPESPVCQNLCDLEYLDWWDYLLTHETGHLLGQRHPHDIDRINGSLETNNSFSSVWSMMSYQNLIYDFGAIDRANWQRNRAGFALLEASRAGREGSPQWNAALDAAAQLDWHGVWAALQDGAS